MSDSIITCDTYVVRTKRNFNIYNGVAQKCSHLRKTEMHTGALFGTVVAYSCYSSENKSEI